MRTPLRNYNQVHACLKCHTPWTNESKTVNWECRHTGENGVRMFKVVSVINLFRFMSAVYDYFFTIFTGLSVFCNLECLCYSRLISAQSLSRRKEALNHLGCKPHLSGYLRCLPHQQPGSLDHDCKDFGDEDKLGLFLLDWSASLIVEQTIQFLSYFLSPLTCSRRMEHIVPLQRKPSFCECSCIHKAFFYLSFHNITILYSFTLTFTHWCQRRTHRVLHTHW